MTKRKVNPCCETLALAKFRTPVAVQTLIRIPNQRTALAHLISSLLHRLKGTPALKFAPEVEKQLIAVGSYRVFNLKAVSTWRAKDFLAASALPTEVMWNSLHNWLTTEIPLIAAISLSSFDLYATDTTDLDVFFADRKKLTPWSPVAVQEVTQVINAIDVAYKATLQSNEEQERINLAKEEKSMRQKLQEMRKTLELHGYVVLRDPQVMTVVNPLTKESL